VPYTFAVLFRCENRFRIDFAFSRSAHPSNNVRGGGCCFFSITRKSPLVHVAPVAENNYLEDATITPLASSNCSFAHFARFIALFSRVAQIRRLKALLTRRRRSPRRRELRGLTFR